VIQPVEPELPLSLPLELELLSLEEEPDPLSLPLEPEVPLPESEPLDVEPEPELEPLSLEPEDDPLPLLLLALDSELPEVLAGATSTLDDAMCKHVPPGTGADTDVVGSTATSTSVTSVSEPWRRPALESAAVIAKLPPDWKNCRARPPSLRRSWKSRTHWRQVDSLSSGKSERSNVPGSFA